ncbi:M20 metallopeptidase family protein [Anaerotignum sp. MB30-C6]|uniref:M20 metallopeptidase family protein n=1 Tax=Anaerotignum sp. MB30-C6 TaxID=3070814 RepID=UPI0027DE84E6|nr:amidohydrolase [Anaerotignum sp. MB30-C6]WMI82002.1 amidohydrolase [Anaerotignum sp. MB30-C6]
MFDIKKEVAELESELIAIRRDIHENPELGYQEFRTSKLVCDYLKDLGLEPEIVTKTGVVAVLRGGAGEGKTIMLRADMDALPVEEETGLPYASKTKGVMHACGHDGHTAVQLIVAKILAAHKDELKGNVKFVFQPNEEEAGALNMIEAGVLENPRVDAALALHLWSPIKTGHVGLSEGPILGTTEEFELEIIGKAGHTSTPHTAKDALLGACNVVQAMQQLGTREFNPLLPIAVMFGYINGGTARNIITGSVKLGGTIRFLFPDEEKNKPIVLEAFERVVKGTCMANDLDYKLTYIPSNPSLFNNSEMVSIVKDAAAEVFETRDNVDEFKSLAGEDFAEFSQRVPSVMTWVGIADTQKKCDFPHHHAKFDIDESMMKYGVELQVRSVLAYLNK